MKHDCPYCGVSLRMKLVRSKPLAGERKLLPAQAVPVCPKCGGEVVINIHWSEAVAGVLMMAPLLAIPATKGLPFTPEVPALGAAVIVGWLVMLVFFHVRYWRHWQRYKKAPLHLRG